MFLCPRSWVWIKNTLHQARGVAYPPSAAWVVADIMADEHVDTHRHMALTEENSSMYGELVQLILSVGECYAENKSLKIKEFSDNRFCNVCCIY